MRGEKKSQINRLLFAEAILNKQGASILLSHQLCSFSHSFLIEKTSAFLYTTVVFNMPTGGYVYIMTNKWKNVLYVGVTSNLLVRVRQHAENLSPHSLTAKYKVHLLVYYAWFSTIEEAIAEEKRIKGGSRLKKIILVESINPKWLDLVDSLRQK